MGRAAVVWLTDLTVLMDTILSHHTAIRKAASWYNAYIKEHVVIPKKGGGLPVVVLLTDDAENRRRAQKEKVPCTSGKWSLFPMAP